MPSEACWRGADMAQNTIIFLWTHVRARSSAFGRAMLERGDLAMFHEPFGRTFYHSDEREVERFEVTDPDPAHRFEPTLGRILAAAETEPVFVKEMAFQAIGRMTEEMLSRFQNTFLVRHPAEMLPSLYARQPDYTHREVGYAELLALYQKVYALTEERPVVVEAGDLQRDPHGIMRAYCARVGLPFKPEALSWEPGLPSRFVWFEGGSWHTSLSQSRGLGALAAPSEHPPVESVPALKALYEEVLPIYEALTADRLTPLAGGDPS